jgi:hypothetical protein
MLQIRGGADLLEEAFSSDHYCEVRVQHLDRDLAIVLQVVSQPDRGHPARPERPLDAVAAGEGRGETGGRLSHRFLDIDRITTRR